MKKKPYGFLPASNTSFTSNIHEMQWLDWFISLALLDLQSQTSSPALRCVFKKKKIIGGLKTKQKQKHTTKTLTSAQTSWMRFSGGGIQTSVYLKSPSGESNMPGGCQATELFSPFYLEKKKISKWLIKCIVGMQISCFPSLYVPINPCCYIAHCQRPDFVSELKDFHGAQLPWGDFKTHHTCHR